MKLIYTYLFFLYICFQIQAQDWVQVASLPNDFNETHHSFAFSFDDLGYIVAGNSDTGMRDDFYQYNPVNDTWTELTPFPGGARGFAIGDTWDGKAYFGFGDDGTEKLNDLWVFDPSDMSWTELASCPCAARIHPAMIAHNGKVLVGLGGSSSGNMNDWWEYDIALNTWSQKDDLPSVPRHHPFQFGIGDYVYTGFGHGDGIFNDWYRYDIAGETWTQVATLPAEGRVAGTQFSYNDIGYVLSGDGDDHTSMETGEFWAYDPLTDTWEELPPHPETSRWAPASFIINGEVYIINGDTYLNPGYEYVTEIYKFNLDGNDAPSSNVQMKIFLEGNYDAATGQMNQLLYQSGLVPEEHPFASTPWNSTATVDAFNPPSNTVDWVLVEAYTGTAQATGEPGLSLVESQVGLLLQNGDVVSPDGSIGLDFLTLTSGGSYHFIVRHRNHLDVLTANPITASSTMVYDFTSSDSQAFGTSQVKQMADGNYALFVGDYLADGVIQTTDYDSWAFNSALVNVYWMTDGNLDGVVQVTDYDSWTFNKSKVGALEVRY